MMRLNEAATRPARAVRTASSSLSKPRPKEASLRRSCAQATEQGDESIASRQGRVEAGREEIFNIMCSRAPKQARQQNGLSNVDSFQRGWRNTKEERA